MSRKPRDVALQNAQRGMVHQVLLVAFLVLVLWFCYGVLAAVSAAVGGGAVLLSAWWFARQFFAHRGSRAAPQIVSAMVRSSFLRLAFIAVVCVIALKAPWVQAPALLAGVFSGVLAPLLVGLWAVKNSID